MQEKVVQTFCVLQVILMINYLHFLSNTERVSLLESHITFSATNTENSYCNLLPYNKYHGDHKRGWFLVCDNRLHRYC